MSTALLCPANVVTLTYDPSPRSLHSIALERRSDPTMDPFGISTGTLDLISVALKHVVGTLGLIDKTIGAYDEAADELEGLQQDLEQLQTQMIRVRGVLKVFASNTKDRAFKKLLQE